MTYLFIFYELQDAFNDLHKESVKLVKLVSYSKKTISSLEKEISNLKFEDLKIVIAKFTLVTSSTTFIVVRKKDHSASACYIRNNGSSIGKMV